MNETNERKTLISIRVSTLLLIVLAIIVLIVVGVSIANKSKQREELEAQAVMSANKKNEESSETGISEAQITSSNKPVITSRSSGIREEAEKQKTVVEEDLTQEIQEVNEENVLEGVQTSEEVTSEVPVLQTTPIEEVKISKDMNLTIRTGLSREDFITLMAGVKEDTTGFFEENAGLIYDMCEKYQLNEIFFCGLISAESGWNIAQNHRNTHNYISLMSSKGLIKYASVEEGIQKAAETLHNNYLTEGGKFYYGPTLAGMKTRFCPASSTWINLVYGRMSQILN